MIKKRLAGLLLALILLASVAGSVSAQSLYFQVTRAVVNVWINTDGSMSIDYVYDFKNQTGAAPIDIIDIGMPADSTWSPNNANAEVHGTALTDIQRSDLVDNAIMVNLGNLAIQPGQSGTFHLRVDNIKKVLYLYEGDRDNYASFQFQPNYFGSEFVTGQTDYSVILRLPPGIASDQPVYYSPKGWPGDDAPYAAYDEENRVTYTWQSTDGDVSDAYTFGAAFPGGLVPEDAIVKAPAITFDPGMLACVCFGLFFVGIIGFSIYGATVGAKKRKLQYLPPKISIEGHGIKRGLTAVEAAILMEQPMDKIMTMILFALVKKGAASVETKEPLKLKTIVPQPEGLNQYEIDFLHAFEAENALTRRKALQDMMIALVKTVSEKMKGFSRKETVTYYEDIIKRAWEQVEAAGTPEIKSQLLEQGLEWTMLDKDFQGHTQTVFQQGPVFLPTWWGHYDPSYSTGGIGHTASGPSVGGAGSSQTSINLPHLPGSDFAASVVGGAQNFASNVLGDLAAFTGGVTQHTNPPPPPSTPSRSGGGGGGGGRSCACACACAGCACACAGGGR